MKAIEFTSKLQDGVIPVPEHYKDWTKQSVKVILLVIESPLEEKAMPKNATDLNRFAGTLSLTEEPIDNTNDEVKRFFENIQLDLSGYRFNRDEANER
ncbi:MAG: hypothetical protein DRR19_21050 [Candidatus Parabeggiatoa sp. nov. 1]|nr:MAG: hypothetical protein DRR19_21050 [Gammaproteobacteria bacterium]